MCHDTKFVATSSFYTPVFGNCCNKHFYFQLVYFVATGFLCFLYNFCCDRIFFCRYRICFLVLIASRGIFVATKLTWLISVLFQFLSGPSFFFRDRILSTCSFYCRDRIILCRDRDFAFNISPCCNMNFFVTIPLVLLFNFYVATENSLSR